MDEGVRQKSFLAVDQTEYTKDNKRAMALLLMLIERKDYITTRLTEIDRIQAEIKEAALPKRDSESEQK